MIRVLIERLVANGMEAVFHRTVIDMRREAELIDGYISGETMREVNQPDHIVVVSTWQSLAHWQNWEASEKRREIRARLRPMLRQPEKITILEHCWPC